MLILYDVPYRGFEGFLKISIIFHFMDIFQFEDLDIQDSGAIPIYARSLDIYLLIYIWN